MSKSSTFPNDIYKSRNNILEILKSQNYDVSQHENTSIHEITYMIHNKLLDMLVYSYEPEPNSAVHRKVYIKYQVEKALNEKNLQDIIEDVFEMQDSDKRLIKSTDTLFIIISTNVSDSIKNLIKTIWENEQIFICVQCINNLKFNILKHTLVPHQEPIRDRVIIDTIKRTENIATDSQWPTISRFDQVSIALMLRPGDISMSLRPSKTAIFSKYYRLCVNKFE